jgi:ectoine hydroxylase-related dioxygenase (phytanoyl-CoA dioxygenase family)
MAARFGVAMNDRFDAAGTVDEVVAAMDEHGYCVVERLLDGQQVRTIKADLERVLESVPSGRSSGPARSSSRMLPAIPG